MEHRRWRRNQLLWPPLEIHLHSHISISKVAVTIRLIIRLFLGQSCRVIMSKSLILLNYLLSIKEWTLNALIRHQSLTSWNSCTRLQHALWITVGVSLSMPCLHLMQLMLGRWLMRGREAVVVTGHCEMSPPLVVLLSTPAEGTLKIHFRGYGRSGCTSLSELRLENLLLLPLRYWHKISHKKASRSGKFISLIFSKFIHKKQFSTIFIA